MNIKSFLVHTAPEQKQKIIELLKLYPYCEVLPSTNKDIIIITLENDDLSTEKQQISSIENIAGVQLLTMIFGAST